MALIEVKDLYKIYNPGENEVRALDGVSLTIDRGEFVAIIGHSGSGKSTFMNMLGLLDVPTSGEYKRRAQYVKALGRRDERDTKQRDRLYFSGLQSYIEPYRAGKCGTAACVPRYARGTAPRSVGGCAQTCRA